MQKASLFRVFLIWPYKLRYLSRNCTACNARLVFPPSSYTFSLAQCKTYSCKRFVQYFSFAYQKKSQIYCHNILYLPLICDTFHAYRISFIQKVHCITSTKYLFIYLEYDKNYNPGQNSWDTNAIARQIESPSLPTSPRCSVDTINTAWGRGGQQK